MKTPVIAIFDIGKTNKKLFLCNEQYGIVDEQSEQLPETVDEDGFPCEDLTALTAWIKNTFSRIGLNNSFGVERVIKAVQFSAYGASFVLLDDAGKTVAPLYNYLKPFPEALKKRFYETYGGEWTFSRKTASPVLGSLNSGMQLYRLKYEKPEVFYQMKYALHLPQYVSFLFSGRFLTDITGVGCHTNLWDFDKNEYHEWVEKEDVFPKLPTVVPSNGVVTARKGGLLNGSAIKIGVGLHDSSAALIPYLALFKEPFVLISTGTWNISMNPWNSAPLTEHELQNDCLQYLSFEGKPVKASRLFAGRQHEDGVKNLAVALNKPADYYKTVRFDAQIIIQLQKGKVNNALSPPFDNYETAYHWMMIEMVARQTRSTLLIFGKTQPARIFVDGGFGKNPVFMQLLANSFPAQEIYAASVAQASAIGAALAIHAHWNNEDVPQNLIELKRYTAAKY